MASAVAGWPSETLRWSSSIRSDSGEGKGLCMQLEVLAIVELHPSNASVYTSTFQH